MKKISVIIPVYNAEKWIEQCVRSVLNNTWQNLEIVCVNDTSPDRSEQILRSIAEEDPRLHVYTKENEGVSKAREFGIAHSDGEYILFVDADDWMEPDTCEKAAAAMEAHSADVVMWSYRSETETRSTTKEIYPCEVVFEGENLKKLHRRFVGLMGEELAHPELADSLCTVWGKLYRRSLLEKSHARFLDLEEIGTYEDGFFNLEVIGFAQKAVYLPEYLYHYRRSTTQSVTSGYRPRLFSQWQNLYTRMEQYIAANELPEIYTQALNNRIALGILGLGLNILASEKSTMGKIHEIKGILKNPRYKAVYKSLNYRYFPIHWKAFYLCAKLGLASGVFVLLSVIRKLIGK